MIKLCIFRIRVRKVLADSVGKRLRAKACALMGAALLAHTANPIEAGSLLPFIDQENHSVSTGWARVTTGALRQEVEQSP